jgi:hypothetical protein
MAPSPGRHREIDIQPLALSIEVAFDRPRRRRLFDLRNIDHQTIGRSALHRQHVEVAIGDRLPVHLQVDHSQSYGVNDANRELSNCS